MSQIGRWFRRRRAWIQRWARSVVHGADDDLVLYGQWSESSPPRRVPSMGIGQATAAVLRLDNPPLGECISSKTNGYPCSITDC